MSGSRRREPEIGENTTSLMTSIETTARKRSLWVDVGALFPLAVALAAIVWAVYARYDGTGFDYDGHLDYLRYVDFAGSFPLADRGWQFYHPPAYYAISAVTFEAAHRLGWPGTLTDAGRAVATTAWILEGVIAAAAVRVTGGNWVGIGAAAALVWLLPGQSIMGSMIYMETMAGLGEGMLVLGVIGWSRGRWWAPWCVAVGFPLASLSKFSGLTAAAATVPILIWVNRTQLRATLVALLPGAVMVAAFYLRNVLAFHTPTPLNSELFHLQAWDPFGRWGNPPGFFIRFDQGLAQVPRLGVPCAAVDSFWGGVWKWLWASDCLQLPWRNQVRGWLLAGALLATLAALIALIWVLIRGRREPALSVLALVPAVVFIAFTFYVIRVPSGTADKGVYLLNAIVPVAVAVGLLLDRLTTRAPIAIGVYVIVLAWGADMAHASVG
jgi:hypothetical protein